MRRLVIFDLDRTLLPGSSLVTLAVVAFRHGLVTPGTLGRALAHNVRFAYSGEHGNIADIARAGVLRCIRFHTPEEFEAVVDVAASKLVTKVRPEMRRALDLHRGLGDHCVVLSASPHELVDRLAHALGAERGIGTRGEVHDGVFTGEVRGRFCHGTGKLDRLAEDLGVGLDELDLSDAVCYADSTSDLPLLEAVGSPIVVAPDRHLRAVAEQRGWPIHDCHRSGVHTLIGRGRAPLPLKR